jgi:NAD kinase
MSTYKKILVFTKNSKLNYLIRKHIDNENLIKLKSSLEYEILNESCKTHEENCSFFINTIKKNLNFDQTLEIFNDDFEKYSDINNFFNLKNKNFDLIFSLGGDGTFLRSLNLHSKKNQIFVGVNTDNKNSKGFYCKINTNKNFLDKNIQNIFEEKSEYRELNKLTIEINNNNINDNDIKNNKTYNFVNDLFFGEKFLGRISKYRLENISNKKSFNIKSSGLIVSTCIYNIIYNKIK